MGCDIHSFLETRIPSSGWELGCGKLTPLDKWDTGCCEPFHERNYALFGFLADVRNNIGMPVITPARGLPAEMSPETFEHYSDAGADAHTPSWLGLDELLAYDYSTRFPDPWEWDAPEVMVRHYLPGWYFERLDQMRAAGLPEDVRVVFWFDN